MFRALPALFLLAGCAPSGSWMLTFPGAESRTSSEDEVASICSTELDENFSDGYSPTASSGGQSEWVQTLYTKSSGSAMFIETKATSGGGAVLVMADAIFPGVQEGGEWVFTWEVADHVEATEEHEDGYRYFYGEDTTSTVTITFKENMFADATGTLGADSEAYIRWEESDEWDPEETEPLLGQQGAIPAATYLVYKDEGDLLPQTNMAEEQDCTDNDCYIQITEICPAQELDFTAKRVEGNEVITYNEWKDNAASSSGGGVDTGF